jgi:hypothetical protein
MRVSDEFVIGAVAFLLGCLVFGLSCVVSLRVFQRLAAQRAPQPAALPFVQRDDQQQVLLDSRTTADSYDTIPGLGR